VLEPQSTSRDSVATGSRSCGSTWLSTGRWPSQRWRAAYTAAIGMDHPYTIGIAGASASGKTTLAGALAMSLPQYDPVILNQDHYFRDWSDHPPEERDRVRTASRSEGSCGQPISRLWTRSGPVSRSRSQRRERGRLGTKQSPSPFSRERSSSWRGFRSVVRGAVGAARSGHLRGGGRFRVRSASPGGRRASPRRRPRARGGLAALQRVARFPHLDRGNQAVCRSGHAQPAARPSCSADDYVRCA